MAGLKLSVSRAIKAIPSSTVDIPAVQSLAFPQQITTTSGLTASKLIDSAGDFINRNIAIGAIIYNDSDGTTATVTAIDSATTLSISADIMDINELYSIYTETTPAAYFYVGVAGNVVVTTSGGDIVTIPNAQVGWHPMNIKRLWATTAATNLLYGW